MIESDTPYRWWTIDAWRDSYSCGVKLGPLSFYTGLFDRRYVGVTFLGGKERALRLWRDRGGELPTVLFRAGRLLVRWGHRRGNPFGKRVTGEWKPLKYEVEGLVFRRLLFTWLTRRTVKPKVNNIYMDAFESTRDWTATTWAEALKDYKR